MPHPASLGNSAPLKTQQGSFFRLGEYATLLRSKLGRVQMYPPFQTITYDPRLHSPSLVWQVEAVFFGRGVRGAGSEAGRSGTRAQKAGRVWHKGKCA